MAVRDFAPGVLGPQAAEWLAGRRSEPVEPRYAATVMLVRDGSGPGGRDDVAGVEVFMLRRVATMAFAPRTWVFPGGGVDPRDDAHDLPWAGPQPREWAALMGCEEGLARALVCAAVREVFEECGVLLAGPSPETVVADLRDPEWDVERAALLSKEQSFAELLLRRGLVLRSDLLSPQGRWVTPDFEPRRYDTFFFAALLPEGQIRMTTPPRRTTPTGPTRPSCSPHTRWARRSCCHRPWCRSSASWRQRARPSSSRPRSRRGRSSPRSSRWPASR